MRSLTVFVLITLFYVQPRIIINDDDDGDDDDDDDTVLTRCAAAVSSSRHNKHLLLAPPTNRRVHGSTRLRQVSKHRRLSDHVNCWDTVVRSRVPEVRRLGKPRG